MFISLASLALLAGTTAALPPSKAPKGFVTTSGTKFKLDGKNFHFAGSNAYVRILATSRKTTGANKSPQYFPFNNNQADVEAGLTAAKKAGLDVFRTWGFNDKNATYNPTGLPQYGGEGAGGTEVVFQRWADGKSTIDVQAFDKVVNAATKAGVKLIVALTNNWADYGGMDVYTVNLGGKYHDDVGVARLDVATEIRLYGIANIHLLPTNSSTASPRSKQPSNATSKPS